MESGIQKIFAISQKKYILKRREGVRKVESKNSTVKKMSTATMHFKLPGVKQQLYHPRLPSLRRMDMDTTAQRLPDEHCRMTTPCTTGDFKRGSVTVRFSPHDSLKLIYPVTGRHWRYRELYSSRINDQEKDDESQTEEETTKATYRDNATATSNNGFRYRNIDPKAWRLTLQQEPFIDHIGQRPIPATAYSRHRTTTSLYGGQVSIRAWRP